MSAFIVELQPYDSVSATRLSLGFSSGLRDEAALGTDRPYPVRLRPDFSYEASVFDGNLPSQSNYSIGNLTLNNADGKYDFLLNYGWGGAPFVVKEVLWSGSTYTLNTFFTGTLVEIAADANNLVLTVQDAGTKLVDALQKNLYLGNGLKEGDLSMVNTPKPLCFGYAKNITPVTVDPVYLTYQYHDGPVEAVEKVYDDAVALTYGGNFTTYESLMGATPDPGSYITCTQLGYLRLGAQAAGTLTCDVQGQFYSSVTAAETLRQILLTRTVLTAADLNAATFAQLSTDVPGRISGLYYNSPSDQISDVIQYVMGTIDSFYYFDIGGKLSVRRFKFSTPTATIDLNDVKGLQRNASAKPVYSVTVDYDRNLTTQSPDSFGIGAQTLNGYLDQETYFLAPGATATGVAHAFLDGTEINVLGIANFLAVNQPSWITIDDTGAYTITAPSSAGSYSADIKVNQQETYYVDTIKLTVASAAKNISVTRSAPGYFTVLPDNTPETPGATVVLTLNRAGDSSAISSWTVVDNLGSSVPVTLSGDTLTLNVNNIASVSALRNVRATLTLASGAVVTTKIPILQDENGFASSLEDLQNDMNAISSDGVLTPADKAILKRDYEDATQSKTTLVTNGTALGSTSQVTAINTAYNNLTSYLNSLSPGWSDTTQNTTVDPATFQSKWAAFFQAEAALAAANDLASSKTANWSGVSDDNGNKPDDNATVGAPSGTPVGSTTADAVASVVQAFPTKLTIDTTPPGVPTGLTVTSSALTDPVTGAVSIILNCAWNTNSESDFAGYDLAVAEGSGGYISYLSATNSYKFTVRANTVYHVKVRSFDKQANYSAYSGVVDATSGKDSVAPGAPTGLSGTAAIGTVFLNWTNPSDLDLDGVEIWENTVNTQPNPSTQPALRLAIVNAAPGAAGGFTRTLSTGTTRYYWVRAVDTSGNVSGFNATAGVALTSAQVTPPDFTSGTAPIGYGSSLPAVSGYTGPSTFFNQTDGKIYRLVAGAWVSSTAAADVAGQLSGSQIAANAIDSTKIAAGNAIVEIVGTLPTSGNFVGRTVMLTTDGKLYRYNGSAFTAAVAAVDVTGQLTATQLANGSVGTAQIAAGVIDATKMASGVAAVEYVTSLPSSGNFSGRTVILSTDGKMYRYVSGAWTTAVAATDLSGQIGAAQIAVGAITASRSAVVDTTNLILDPNFSDTAYWAYSGGMATSTNSSATAAIVAPQVVVSPVGNGTTSQSDALAQPSSRSFYAPVEAGKQYRVSYTAYVTSGFTGIAFLNYGWFAQDGTTLIGSYTNVNGYVDHRATAAAAAGTEANSQLITAPVGAAYIKMIIYVRWSATLSNAGQAYVGAPRIMRATTTDLLTDASVTAAKISSSSIDNTKLVANLTAVEYVSTLPSSGNYAGRTVILSTDGKLYRYVSGAWSAAAAAGDLTGQIATAQIANNAVTAAQIGSAVIDNTKLVNGLAAVEFVTTLPASGNFQGRTVMLSTDGKLYRWNNAATTGTTYWSAAVATVDLTGTITSGQIGAGAVNTAAIANSAITAAQIANAAVTSAALGSGAVTAAAIAAGAIDNTKLVSNLAAVEYVTSLPASGNYAGRTVILSTDGKLYRYVGSAWTAAVAAADLTGTIGSGQIGSGAVGSTQLAANSVTTASIVAGAISASKLANTDTANLIIDSSFADTSYWSFANSNVSTDATATAALFTTPVVATVAGNGTTSQSQSNVGFVGTVYFPVEPGKPYRFYAQAYVQSGYTGYFVPYLQWFTAAKALISATNLPGGVSHQTTAAAAAAVETVDSIFSSPTNAAYARITYQFIWSTTLSNAGQAFLGNVRIMRATDSGTLTDSAVVASKIATAAIDNSKLINNLAAVELVSSLPSTGNFQGRTVMLSTDGKLYRWNNAATTGTTYWSAAVPAADLTGTITTSQIGSGAVTSTQLAPSSVTTAALVDSAITAAKIGTSAVTAAAIATGIIDNTKLVNGLAAVELVSSLPSTGNFQGRTVMLSTDGKLYRWNNAATTGTTYWSAAVPAADLTGTITSSQIGTGAVTSTQLAPSSVTTAALVDSAITAAKIGSSAVTAAAIAANAIDNTKLAANLAAIELVSSLPSTGNFQGRTVMLSTDGKLYRWNNAATTGTTYWSAAVATVDLTGTLTSTQIGSGTVTATQLAPSSVTTAAIVASAITASKISTTVPSSGNLIPDPTMADQASWSTSFTPTATLGLNTTDAILAAMGVPSAWKGTGNGTTSQAANYISMNSGASMYVESGTVYRLSMTWGVTSGFTGDCTMFVRWFNAAGTQVGGDGYVLNVGDFRVTAASAQTIGEATNLITAPATAVKCLVYPTFNWSGGQNNAGSGYIGYPVLSRATTADTIAAGVIDNSKLVSNLAAVEFVTTLPASGNFQGRTVMLSTDGKLYRWNNAATTGTTYWSAAVPAADVSGTITGTQIANGSISTPQLAANAVTAANIAANTITSAQIAANTITAAQIAAATITATQLAANSITASKLVVGDVSNYVQDPQFTDSGYWSFATGAAPNNSSSFNALMGVNQSVAFTPNGTTTQSYVSATLNSAQRFTVEGGASYRLNYQYSYNSGCNGHIYCQVAWYKADGSTAASTAYGVVDGVNFNTVAAASNAVGVANGIITAPSDALYASFQCVVYWGTTANSAGTCYIGYPMMLRANAGELTVDGSITAAKIKTGTITATQIAASTITGTQIAATTITGANMVAGTITATQIATGTITGDRIAANTIATQSLLIGTRGITSASIVFNPNNPSTNAVSWTGGTLAYIDNSGAAQAVTITAGSITGVATRTYICWTMGATAFSSTTSYATATTGSNVLIATYNGGLDLTMNFANTMIDGSGIRTNSVTATQIAASTITAAQIAANTITSAQIAANTITAAQIAAGTITATQLAANSVTASKLNVADVTNYVQDPNFSDASYWSLYNGTFVTAATDSAALTAMAVNTAFKSSTPPSTAGSNCSMNGAQKFSVEGGASYRFNFQWYVTSGFTGLCWGRIYWYKADGTTAATGSPTGFQPAGGDYRATAASAASANSYSLITTAPSDALYAYVWYQILGSSTLTNAGTGYIGYPIMQRANGGELTVDGSVTAAKIAAGTITATQIASGTITGDRLVAGTITSTQIQAGTITGDRIAANTIAAQSLLIGTRGITSNSIVFNPNSPATNQVAWTAGNIAYIDNSGAAQSVAVTAGNLTWSSGRLYIYWTMGAGTFASTATLATANSGSNLLIATYNGGLDLTMNYANVMVDGSGIRANSVTASQIAASTITATQIAANTITSAQIAANTITANQIASGTITASQIASSTITSAQIAAGTISASNLVVGVLGDNIIPNPDAEGGDTSSWYLATGAASPGLSNTTATFNSGSRSFVITKTATSGTTAYATTAIPVKPGTVYTVRISAKADAASSQGFYLRMAYAATKPATFVAQTAYNDLIANAALTTTWTTQTFSWTCPAGMYWVSPAVYNWSNGPLNLYFDDLYMREQISASLIVNGAITSTQIAAATITGANMVAGTLTATQIAAGSITGDRLTANTITAAQIAANTITAAQIAASTITSSQIAANTITAAQIAANTITSAQIAANTITAGQIAAGTITAAQLAASSVTASKLVVGDVTNYVQDPQFTDNVYWAVTAGAAFNTTDATQLTAMAVSSAVKFTGTGMGSGVQSYAAVSPNQKFSLEGGKSYRFDAQYYIASGYTGNLRLICFWYKSDGVTAASTAYSQVVVGNYTTAAAASNLSGDATGIVVSPIDALYGRFALYTDWSTTLTNAGTAYLAYPIMQRAMSGELIVDGAITASKIAANTITATQIAAGTITGANLVAGTITSTQIAAGTITGDRIAANTIATQSLLIGTRGITSNSLVFNPNNPATNQVSWTAGAIVYVNDSGVPTGVAITAGNATWTTGRLYIYWVKGATTLSSTTDAPTAMASANNLLMATYAGGLDLTLNYANAMIDGSGIRANSVTATQIAANTITAAQIAAQTITAAQIATGTITASQIAANAITASRLYVGDAANYILDPGFTDVNYWTTMSGGAFVTSATDSAAVTAMNVVTALKTTTVGTGMSVYAPQTQWSTIEAGATYRFSYSYYVTSGFTGVVYLTVYFFDQTGVQLSASNGNAYQDFRNTAAAAATVGTKSFNLVAPTNALYCRVVLNASWSTTLTNAGTGYIGYPIMNRASDGSLVVDGSITASKIAAGSITAAQIAAGTITATQIASGTITGTQIAANTITTSNLIVVPGNLIANPDFNTGSLINWRPYSTPGNISVVPNTTSGVPTGASTPYVAKYQWTAGTMSISMFTGAKAYTDAGSVTDGFAVTPGQQYFTGISLGKSSDLAQASGTTTVSVLAYFYKSDGTTPPSVTAMTVSTASITTAFQDFTGSFTVPAGVSRCWMYVYSPNMTAGALYFTNLRVWQMSSASLIVDGTITGSKIAGTTITAANIAGGTITATQLAANSVTATQLAANSVTAAAIQANTITAAQIASGTITAAQLAANSVTATQIAVGDFQNLAWNGDFQNGSANWTLSGGASISSDATNGWNGSNYVFSLPPSATAYYPSNNNVFPCKAGDEFYLDWWGKVSAALTGSVYVYVRFIDKSGAQLGTANAGSLTSQTTYTEFSVKVVAPANAVQAQVNVSCNNTAGTAYIGQILLYRRNKGSVLVDGSVTATQIAASTITGTNIAGSTITGANIAGTTITAANIAGQTITAAQIATGTITASQLAANSITASKLVVGDVNNFVQDPTFTDSAYWTLTNATFNTSDTTPLAAMAVPAAFKTATGNGTKTQASSSASMASGQQFTIESGGSYRINYCWYAAAAFTGAIYILVRWYRYDGNASGIPQTIVQGYPDYRNVAAASATSGVVNTIITAPTDAVYAVVSLTMDWSTVINNGGYGYMGYPIMNRASDGQLIVDGTITTSKLAAGAVTASTIASGTITATQIASSTITAANIAAGTISATQLQVGLMSQQLIYNGSPDVDNLGGMTGWYTAEGSAFAALTQVATSLTGMGALRFNLQKAAAANSCAVGTRPFAVVPGETYQITWTDGCDAATTNGKYARIFYGAQMPASGQLTQTTRSGFVDMVAGNSAWAVGPNNYTYNWTCPSGVHVASFVIYDWPNGPVNVYLDNVSVLCTSSGAVVIGPGTITADSLTANSITAAQIAAGTITATQIASATITGTQIAANTISASNIVAATITSAQIAAGTIGASNIAANAITASKLVVGDVTNFVQDPNFTDTAYWQIVGTGGSFVTSSTDATAVNAMSVATAFKSTGNGTKTQGNSYVQLGNSQLFSVEGTGSYRLSASYYYTSGFSGRIYLQIGWYKADGVTAASVGSSQVWGQDFTVTAAAAAGTGVLDGVITAPADALFGRGQFVVVWSSAINSAGSGYIGYPIINRAYSGNLIVDGSITSVEIAANTITAAQIAANTITTSQIAARTIVAANIATNTITTSEIAANTIVAANISAGAIGAAQIAAGAITADKIAVYSNGQNLIQNSGFENGDLSGWGICEGGSTATLFLGSAISSGSTCLNVSKTSGQTVAVGSFKMPTTPGRIYRIRATSYFNTAATSGYYIRIQQAAASFTQAIIGGSTFGNVGIRSGYTDLVSNAAHPAGAQVDEYTWTCPSGVNWATLSFYNWSGSTATVMAIDDVQFQEQITTAVIADGAITATKIVAGSITSTQIAAQTITAANIVNGTITSTQIAAATITGNNIAATTITGNNIVAGTLTATQIQAGSISTDRLASTGSLPANLTIGTTGYSLGTAQTAIANTQIVSLYDAGGLALALGVSGAASQSYVQQGNTITRTSTAGGTWAGNAYSLETYANSCTLSGRPSNGAVFMGITDNRAYVAGNTSQYSYLQYAWYFDGTNYNIRENGSQIQQVSGVTGVGQQCQIIYDGKGVYYYINGALARSVGTTTGRVFYAGYAIGTLNGAVQACTFGSTADNSLQNADPAARINAYTTQINPGMILISGGTSLLNWRNGGDTTKIEGGSIAANTIRANSITIGSRNVNFSGLNFRASGNTLIWDGGAVQYVDDSGNIANPGVSGGSFTWTGSRVYVWWNKGATALNAGTGFFSNPDDYQLGSYDGANNINMTYGRTLINNDWIQTGTITANSIAANTITAAQIAAATITATQIASGTITANQIAAGSITGDRLTVGMSGNMLYGADGALPFANFMTVSNPAGGTIDYGKYTDPNYRLADGSGYYLHQVGGTSGSYTDIVLGRKDAAGNLYNWYNVQGGLRYQMQCWMDCHRSQSEIYIDWQDVNGNHISYTESGYGGPENAYGNALQNYRRCYVFGTAPSNAARAQLFLRKTATLSGNSDSYMFWAQPYFGYAAVNQTEPGPWSAGTGGTVIDGSGVITNTIVTNHLVDNSVSQTLGLYVTSQFTGQGTPAGSNLANGAVGDGSGGSGGGAGGGGHPVGCVHVASFMPTGGLAREVRVGDPLLVLDYQDHSRYYKYPVGHVRHSPQPSYRITTTSGITLVASDSTPITTRGNHVLMLPQALGYEVPVLDDGGFRWERIVRLEYLGTLQVAVISADGMTYAAGEKPGRYIFTHNPSNVKV